MKTDDTTTDWNTLEWTSFKNWTALCNISASVIQAERNTEYRKTSKAIEGPILESKQVKCLIHEVVVVVVVVVTMTMMMTNFEI